MSQELPPITSLGLAFKEWAAIIAALEAGETIALLRKGGLRERGSRFQIRSPKILLYPTYEHQQPQFLKGPYRDRAVSLPVSSSPKTVQISSWAEITEVLTVSADSLLSVLPYHVGNEDYAQQRWHWQPQHPLYLLLLRTYLFPQPQVIPYRSSYGGCRSWIELETVIALTGQPALSDADYGDRSAAIRQRVGSPVGDHGR
ncbi:MAG: DUF1802 family protein [Chloroflexaceae bacterium]|nr:DUF1802 family protein [Chloroflexaceae bacterium]